MKIRNLDTADLYFTYTCRNDKESRRYARTMHKITREEHRKWFNKKLHESNTNRRAAFYVGEIGNPKNVGVIRFTSTNPPEIAIHLHPSMRGQGYGILILRESIKRYLQENPLEKTLMATIKPGNKSSIRIFEKVGFKATGELDPKDESCDVYILEVKNK